MIVEDFVVEEYIKPVVTAKIGNNQYDTVPKSSTMQALISMVHTWSKHTNGDGATVHVVLFDFRKAFNLIDHWILAKKARELRSSLTDCELGHQLPEKPEAARQAQPRLFFQMGRGTCWSTTRNKAPTVVFPSYDQ